MVWLPIRPVFVQLLARTADGLISLVDHPPVIRALSARSDSILVYSDINGGVRPLAAWSGATFHVHVLTPIALVLAVPLTGRRRRAALLALSILLVTLLSVLLCTVQLKSLAAASAERQLTLVLTSARETEFLDAANRALTPVGMSLLPAFLFLVPYVSFQGKQAREVASRHGLTAARPGLHVLSMEVLTGVALVATAGSLMFLASASRPSASEYREGLNKVKRLNPGSALARCSLGAYDEQQGHLEEAATSYREALDLDPNLATAHYALGNVLFQQGALEEAAEAYRRALVADPTHVSAHLNLGITLIRQGRHAEAARALEDTLRFDPQRAAAHHNLALALLALDRPCEALPHLEWSVSLDRTFAIDPAERAEIARLKPGCGPQAASHAAR